MTPEAGQALGFAHFLSQTDAVAKTLLAILLLMSIATWYVVLDRIVSGRGLRAGTRRAIESMKSTTSATELAALAHGEGPFARLTAEALVVGREAHDAACAGDDVRARRRSRACG